MNTNQLNHLLTRLENRPPRCWIWDAKELPRSPDVKTVVRRSASAPLAQMHAARTGGKVRRSSSLPRRWPNKPHSRRPRPVPVRLVVLNRERHLEKLREIVSDPQIMKWIANGKTWDSKKLNRFFQYCERDTKLRPSARENQYWGIIVDGKFAGVVGVNPIRYDRSVPDGRFAICFMAKWAHGKGYGGAALRVAICRYRRAFPATKIYADVRVDNQAASKSITKVGFALQGAHSIRGTKFNRWALAPNRAPK